MGDPAALVRDFQDTFAAVRGEVGRRIIGHAEAIDDLLIAFFAGGHVLIEGVPGIGKTLLVRSLAEALGLAFGRVQFTIDVMPADIVGTRIIEETPDGRRAFVFQPGPIFTQVLLADEVNRATPKTQSALLEAMAEEQVTVAAMTHALPQPFFVLATLNPIEMEGTYALPEAQLDRFLLKVVLDYPSEDELVRIVGATTGVEPSPVRPVFDAGEAPARVAGLRRLVREVLVEPDVERWVARLVRSTVPGMGGLEIVDRHVAYGASPRGAQALLLGAKVVALLDGRPHATREDVARVALPALRHRLVPSLAAEAAGIHVAAVIEHVLAAARGRRA